VLVQFAVDTFGRAKMNDLTVVSSADDAFTVAVRSAMASMRFIPATRGGNKIEQTVQLPFEFNLYGSDASRDARAPGRAIGVLGAWVVTVVEPSLSQPLRLQTIITTAVASPRSATGGAEGALAGTVPDSPAAPKRGNATPRYPEPLRVAGVEGEVIAQFVVDEQGRADLGSFTVLRSTDRLFASAVRDAVAQAQFYSAKLNGQPIKQIVQVPVRFNVVRR
jgi:TonB family protein